MAIQVALEHRTTYKFDRSVSLGPHVVRLRPAPHCRTPILAYSLTVTPAEHFINWQQDPFGNHLARLVFPGRTDELSVTVDLIADLTVINPLDFFIEDYAAKYPFEYEPALAADLEPYRRPTPGSDLLGGWLAENAPEPGRPIVLALADLNAKVAKGIAYTVRMEQGVQTPDQTLQAALGSCRDSGWLLVAVLRRLGMAARFVSGYLVQLKPDADEGTLSNDFTDLHAWAEVYLPGAGWVGLDATSGLFAGEGHIPLSATPSPGDSAPISGTTDVAGSEMMFSNTVRRIREDPRVTKPYDDRQWREVLALGATVDARLVADDVRLTMGGEPTFVSIDDMEAAEWATAADGKQKRRLATELAGKLKAHYAPDGVVHHGQGKWYPGEPLPRWQIAMTWRADGTALWKNPALLDDPWGPRVFDDSLGRRRAGQLIRRIADFLGISEQYVLPAYEDTLSLLVGEARLPVGPPPDVDIDPDDPQLATADLRTALATRLDTGGDQPSAYVLPLHRSEDGTHWATTRWRMRRGRLVLMSGTSPAGLRLPLDSIAWTPPPVRPDAAPFAAADDLPDPGMPIQTASVTPVEDAPTTALVVEARDGHLFVFLPPLASPDIAVELLTVLADAAGELGAPIVIEGYPIPGSGATKSLTVTPDPGVIEVNVQPAASWDELVEIAETLHTAAHDCRLGTEKFALDGTHTGTGGGSHLTLGGRTPAESPLLRRPDLLVSMLTFWQHHPALSYLFSGRFIGPTSQAPRVDEARHENLYELEIAFAELDRLGDKARPWSVDRALRHLLTDLTGNTHRSEFCIDKLFSPDSERGRLGLLELRGFEMPPHRQMSLVQALLVRCLVARFWREPYRGPLVRWGTGLHDRFLLPAFVAADIADVVADLAAHGIAFDSDWLDPFLEFRFPRLGSAQIGPVLLELRSAIEPWHVLGEEATGSGTARYVDSSLERLQVAVSGATPGRHVVTVNGAAVPLHDAGTRVGGGDLVAGVRFRAWAPPSALHPSIGVHSPLVFDVLDSWSGRSLGGCTYHVVHPGGRSYDRFPVNAAEAEARRSSRFTTEGHTAGPVEVPQHTGSSAEYPFTLDLRRTAAASR